MIQAASVGEYPLAEFGRDFMDKFQSDQSSFAKSTFVILNEVFLDCDEFEPDADLYAKLKATSPDFVIDANDFNRRLRANLERLMAQS